MAFSISEKLGLDKNILERAKSLSPINSITTEELLKKLHDDTVIIEKEKENIKKKLIEIQHIKDELSNEISNLKNKELSIINNAKLEARKILLEAKEDANSFIKELKNTNNTNKSTEKINKKINNIKFETNSNSNSTLNVNDIKIGMKVYISSLSQHGTILTMPNKSGHVQVQVGSAKMNVSIDSLSKSTDNKKQTSSNSSNSYVNNKIMSKSKTISSEINVIGLTIEEAINLIDKYLDDSSLANINSVRIVHGKGTGVLRKRYTFFLKNSSSC